MNIFSLLLILISTVIIYGLPIWNLSRLKKQAHPLWWIIPPVLFLCIFWTANLLEGYEIVNWYRVVNTISYTWLIFGAILFGISLLLTLFQYAFRIKDKHIFWAIIVISLGFITTAWIQGNIITVKNIELEARYIQRSYHFVHISDLHSGSTTRAYAQRVADHIQNVDPEFVVITGDFIDEFFVKTEDIQPIADLSMPTFLITGNHEYYLEPGTIQEVLDGTDIQLIDDTKISFEDLDIIGVNERATVDTTLDMLGGIDSQRYTILLDHQPKTDEVERAEERGVSLMLSGHTHMGQIWPTHLLIRLQFKYVGGLYEIGNMLLYVNQGTGTLGPRLRLGTVNEITHITLVPRSE